MKKYIIIVFFFFVSIVVKSQDFVYSNYLMSPIYLNPALAGVSKGTSRFVINYRDQYPGIKNAYKCGSISVDQKINAIKGALAFSYDYSNEGSGFYTKNNFGLTYSFHGINIPIKKRYDLQVALALQGNYVTRSIDYDNLIFYDQIDIENGLISGIASEASMPVNNFKGFFDLSSGITFIYRNLVGGAACHHMVEPNESLISSESLLKRKYNIHVTYYGRFGKKRNSRKLFTPTMNIYYQDQLPVVMLGAQFKYMYFTIGQWCRSATHIDGGNSIMWTFVFDTKQLQEDDNWKLGFSYDCNILGMGGRNTFGAVEVNLIYQSKNPRFKNRRLKCPDDFW